MEYKWCSVVHEDPSILLCALSWVRRAGLYQTLWYCYCADSTGRFHNPLGIALINDRMVRIFRLDDGSFAVETRASPDAACAAPLMTVDELDQHATFWNDDLFGTSIVDGDGLAKFTATVLTAMYLAASGSKSLWVDTSGAAAHVHPASKEDAPPSSSLMQDHEDEQDANEGIDLVEDDDDDSWSLSDDELEMSDNGDDNEYKYDEEEEFNFTKYRSLLKLAETKLRLVSSDAMDRIAIGQGDITG